MTPSDWRVFRLAKRQDGVVSYAQLRALGVTDDARRWRLRTGEWVVVLPGVMKPYWADETWRLRVRAASLWLGENGWLSHSTAAAVHGLRRPEKEQVHVSRRPRGRLPAKWVVLHLNGRAGSGVEVGGVRVRGVARTLVELAGGLSEEALEGAMRKALKRRLVSLEELGRELSARKSVLGGGRAKSAYRRLVRGCG